MVGHDVVIVGGGLAGLSCSLHLAKAGRSVTILEKSGDVGGRARTQNFNGFSFNMGRHALSLTGSGASILHEFDVPFKGGKVGRAGYGLLDGKLHELPVGFISLLATKLLSARSKIKAARLLNSLPKLETDNLERVSLREWLEGEAEHHDLIDLLEAYFRAFTYSNDSNIESAGAAINQLKKGLAGVLYVDGGWQTLVDGLLARARELGVKVVNKAGVQAVEHDGSVTGVRLSGGRKVPADDVVLAVGPRVAAELVQSGGPSDEALRWARELKPVRAATLEVGLSRLPNPECTFVMGIGKPVYLSVHSKYARLAPDGGAMIHVMKCLGSLGEPSPEKDRAELNETLDVAQPRWRSAIAQERFLPNMVVSNALVTAVQGGTKGRPGPKSHAIENLYLAGDWVGPEGLLSDASFASAKLASESILDRPECMH